MALIQCPNCGRKVSENATSCPQCGLAIEEIKRILQEQQTPKPTEERSEQKKKLYVLAGVVAFLVVAAAGIAVWFLLSKKKTDTVAAQTEQVIETGASQSTAGGRRSINYTKVENLLNNISRNSSKGGYYDALADYFTYEIYPHPSGEIRYNYNIGEKTKNYVERFEEYYLSAPYNLTYETQSFPLVVTCEVEVTWTKNGTRKKAWIEKTYYITEDYKVSGYIDNELRRETCEPEGYMSVLSERKLTYSDIAGKSSEELALMRNSIYARHGYKFKKQKYQDYFGQCTWYRPTTDDAQKVYKQMSSIEQYNVDFIKGYE